MSIESVHQHQRPRLRTTDTLLWFLLLGFLLTLCMAGALWSFYERRCHFYDRLCVGMTVEDVVEQFGEPARQSEAGEPLDPPHVSGFVPHRTDYAYVYTYDALFAFVYVLFDAQDHVMVYYVYGK